MRYLELIRLRTKPEKKQESHAGCFARNILVLSVDPMVNDVSIGVRILLFGRHP